MFSSTSHQAHAKRKRIFASTYSKTAVTQDRVQTIIRTRVSKLVDFLERQTKSTRTRSGEDDAVVVRHVFRALQADVFTAFAFSGENGAKFLDHLKPGANTMEDLGMDDLDLFHDERREPFFFWESEKPFKYITNLIARQALPQHLKSQRWISELITKCEAELKTRDSTESPRQPFQPFDRSVYEKLLHHASGDTGKSLSWLERASEVMDHAGMTC